jgi:hypothetical protein
MFSRDQRTEMRQQWFKTTEEAMAAIDGDMETAAKFACDMRDRGQEVAAAVYMQSWSTLHLSAQMLRCALLLDVGLQGIEAQLRDDRPADSA